MPGIVQDKNEDGLCCQQFTVQHFNLKITLLDGPPPPHRSLKQPISSFKSMGLCICSSLWGHGLKTYIRKNTEKKTERNKYTFQLLYSKTSHRYALSIKTQLNVILLFFHIPFPISSYSQIFYL